MELGAARELVDALVASMDEATSRKIAGADFAAVAA
jgi:hypothetical protein